MSTNISVGVTADLLKQSIRLGQECSAEVVSGSMAPVLFKGDAVIASGVDRDGVRCGDLLLVESENALITHRLIAFTPDCALLKGDANRYADSPVSWNSVIGRVERVKRRSGAVVDLLHPAIRLQSTVVAIWSRLSHEYSILADRKPRYVLAARGCRLILKTQLALLRISEKMLGARKTRR